MFHKKEFDHTKPSDVDLTKLILACPSDEFIIKVYDSNANVFVFQIPVDYLDDLRIALDTHFSLNGEQYSVRLVCCSAQPENLLSRICATLKAKIDCKKCLDKLWRVF
jgi:hypothetical protein